MKIALIQQKCTNNRELNRHKGLEAVRKAADQGAKVICFAELSFDPFYPQIIATSDKLKLAEPIPGPTTEMFSGLAQDLDIVIILNLFERDGEHTVAICYDRHYTEYMRALALNGAEIVFVPQAGAVGEWPRGLYEAELQVAAFQNGFFTALCNRVGEESKLTFSGGSFICNPDGKVIVRADEGKDQILLSDVDLNKVKESFAKQLFIPNRRPELYADWLSKTK